MNHNELLQASCRVALAGLLHDIGKFAERAKISVENLDDNKQLYCPHHKNYEQDKGWFSHVHAAYTGLAIDLIEQHAPKFKTGFPFAQQEADDSLINAAARHHKPDTFLQWIIATADRVASGFERETFDEYNKAEEKKNHYTSRQITLFEQIHLGEEKDRPKKDSKDFNYRYSLKPLSPESIFPVKAEGYESNNNEKAQAEYKTLWNQFIEGLKDIPESHRKSLSLWLDHFDSCWQTYTHTIPSATASGTRPEVSLYDHSKAVAALATALWRYHHELKHDEQAVIKKIQSREDWNEEKLLLVQGDFFGIQHFIFAEGGESTKKAAKLLRGRSFYVSLITECAALAILETLQLPSSSQMMNAAGKFLIVAPNTPETIHKLEKIQETFNTWFLKYSYGQSGLGLAWQKACCNDFVNKKLSEQDEKTPFELLNERLHTELERRKYQHFDLCGDKPTDAVFKNYLDSFNNEYGVCKLNDKSPAQKNGLSQLAEDQINIGTWLINKQRLIVAKTRINGLSSLILDLFGYYIHFTEEEDRKGNFGKEVSNNNIRRAFDFSRPEKNDALWHGYARRNISGYVPYFEDANEWISDKYTKFLNPNDLDETTEYQPKTLNHLALEDLNPSHDGQWYGIKALSVLKGDIDNLGALFHQGLKNPTFAKNAALSRQVNNFFAVYLPYLCQKDYPNTYIVFAGGDDFFLLGSWHNLIKLANKLRSEFQRYVANNKNIHFSAGLTVMKPKIPIYQLAEIAEEALEQSKHYEGKNAVTCFGETVSWDNFSILTNERYQHLNDLRDDLNLSTAYIYSLLRLTDMASAVDKPENALWRSQLYYRTYRTVANTQGLDKEQKKSRAVQLISDIGVQGIERFKKGYRITLQAHLYKNRKQG